jgi:hypothetical protein
MSETELHKGKLIRLDKTIEEEFNNNPIINGEEFDTLEDYTYEYELKYNRKVLNGQIYEIFDREIDLCNESIIYDVSSDKREINYVAGFYNGGTYLQDVLNDIELIDQYAMIIQAMDGIDEDEILEKQEQAKNYLKWLGYKVLNTYFEEEYVKDNKIKNIGVKYLSKGLEQMAKCSVVYCLKGWETARGCKIEHEIAKQYGLKILYENDVL